jgi:uncharacterized protein with HEPN domain
MQSNDFQRLKHIKRYCEDIIEHTKRFGGYDEFVKDSAFHQAVSMCILQIGELSNGLSSEFRNETKGTIQWALVRGIRNWAAHSYDAMDDEILWDTASNSIPLLLAFCNEQLSRE